MMMSFLQHTLIPTEGADYEITLGSIVFSPGVPAGSTRCFVVQIISDQNNNEIAESFRLFLLRNDEIMDELPITIVGGMLHWHGR